MIDLRLGDCLEVMKTIPDNSVDLVITSPPYDKLRNYKGYTFNFEGIAKELFRVIKQGGVIVWVVGDQTINGSESGTSFKQALYFKEIGFNLHDTMIWHKPSCNFPDKKRYYQYFEYMFIFSKGSIKTYNLLNDKKNRYFGCKVARIGGDRNKDGKLVPNSAYKNNKDKIIKEFGNRGNVWYIPTAATEKERINHPAKFPEKLANDHILSWSNEGDTVLDPMMGSGTVGEMAKLNKRNFIGIEISPEYFEIAKRRIDNTMENLL
jgi:site-specific DNA-methyltransferase (adenine-specific)